MWHHVYLSLGSNIGDRKANLSQAQELLAAEDNIRIKKVSHLYQTSPVGGVPQDDFINQAIAIETQLDGYTLLDKIHTIEAQLHRKREIVWGPRTLDIDILFYDEMKSSDKVLTLPHPEVFNRLFVLVPLAEITDSSFAYYDQVKSAITALQTSDQQIERIG